MDLVVTGLANKQVAVRLHCSGKTVELHRARVMEKMEADSLARLVRMSLALENAWEKRKRIGYKVSPSSPYRSGRIKSRRPP